MDKSSLEARPSITRRTVLGAPLVCLAGARLRAESQAMRAGVFRSDVTPEPGEPLIWITPAAKIEDPLWARGVILEDRGGRYVLCAVDWCGLANSTHLLFRSTIARAAGVSVDHVMVQTVHQHTAPYIDGDAYAILGKLREAPLRMSDGFLGRIMDRLAQAVRDSAAGMRPFDSVGTGQSKVDRVASARRFLSADGKPVTRYSNGAKRPELAALPEGDIDPLLRTITLAAGNKPLVRLHYYATHPQTFCCDGSVSGDIVSRARADVESGDGVFQIYFTGCAGDVTVGKYNDGTAEAQAGLTQRLGDGMRAAIRATKFAPVSAINWRLMDVALKPKVEPRVHEALVSSGKLSGADLYRAAITLAFANRKRPLQAAALEIGNVSVLHLPGEPFLEFQRYALTLRPDRFVAMAGYGDISPGYLCTDRAVAEGGYEPGAANAGPGVEATIKQAIRNLLEGNSRRL